MKAALYFENADGFGEWRILISTEAYKNLRELRKSEKKTFKIIVGKIKQLSNGYFSDDNHKRLNGPDAGIPIYDAKMTKDLRLVYQIDCVPDQDGKVLIKVYGIYTHAQLGKVWDALGNHLARKGREYRRRCIFRNRPVLSKDSAILPASFPSAEPEPECSGSPLNLSDKDMDRVEYFQLSFVQALIHGTASLFTRLIANQDVQHVFMLTPQEQKIVECITSCYVLGRSGTGKTTTMLFKILGIQRAWEMSAVDMPKPRQIFVTKSRVLATKVEEYFTKLLESLALAGYTLEELAKMKARSVQEGLVDLDDLPESQMNVPMRYSGLEDKHFPLFLTFDRLAKMIAADILDKTDSAGAFFNVDNADAHDCFVTYDVFANQYWPHFPQNLSKNLNSWLVFSEFMGIIKGSEHALTCPEGILDRPAYLLLSHRSNPNFANQREILYDMFEYYTKMKRQRRHHDVADRTHAILKVFRSKKFPGQQIDYLYVDEAQDNLLIDALFLRQLCKNPDGLFWAGDTAQTISAGSSFRFNDLKAFLYRVEQQNISVNSAGAGLRQPAMFQLAINYRSHGGIVNCASSVIELITKFWPNTIDNLQPEKGVVDGLKPVFFTGWDKDTVRYEQFLFGESGSHIEFGAGQCILVRDDAARQKLRDQVGQIGLIMTLYESKGLEFNDVLLYNFFEDSAVDLLRWRIVLSGVDGQGYAPNFDEARHAGVCSELKLLYVGITRARKNIWIIDKSDRSEPMRKFWTSRDQIKNCTPGTDVPHLAVSSTPEEWASFGRSLFSHKRYSQAVHCFERANLRHEVKVCEAYQLRDVARSSVGVASLSDQKRAFNVAADAFTDCGATATGNQKLQYYRNSADCYVRAGDDLKAAKAYLNAQEFEQAAKRYRKAGRFDKTLHVLDDYGTDIPEETKTELRTVCRLFYCSRNNAQVPLSLFSTFEEQLEFLEDYDLDYARASLLESHSMYYKAAELHLSENRPLEAVRAFIKDDSEDDSTSRAADAILEYFWRQCSFRITAKSLETNKLKLATRDLVRISSLKVTAGLIDIQISMFQTILRGNHEPLRNLALNFDKQDNKPAALLCLDHIFSRTTDIRAFTVDEMQRFLQQFHAYARLLYLILTFPDPMEHSGIQRLFSIVRLSGDEFLIPDGTFLHNNLMEDRQGITWVSEHSSGYTASRRVVTQLLQQSIRTILKDKISEIDDMCCKSPVFSQCLQFLISVCRRDNCPQEHVAASKLDRQYYNKRVAIHIWQILILQFMYSAHPYIERRKTMRHWLKHLYEAINPPFFVQGSPADLDINLMPLRLEGMKVVKLWIRESFYSLDPFHTQAGFLTALMGITSLSFAFDRNDAHVYISRSKCAISGPLELFRKEDNRYMVRDLLNSYQGAIYSSISSGILYLLHVLDNRVCVNLSVLCDCIEDVCGAFVIKYRMDPGFNRFPLHNAVLPCSWLLFPHKFTTEKETKLFLMGKLLDEIARLVEALRVEAGMGFSALVRLLSLFKNPFAAKLYSLVAHNIRKPSIGVKIYNIIFSLHKNNPPSNWRLANYRNLVDDVVRYMTPLPGRPPLSDAYLRALLAFDDNTGVGNLVHLVHKMDQHTRVYTSIGRRLVYEKTMEIPHLLSSYAVIAQSTLRVEAPAFVPGVGHCKDQPEVMQHDEKEITEPQPQDFEEEELEGEEDVTANANTETRDASETLDEAATLLAPDLDESLRTNGPSVEEEEAGCKIQKAYRRYVRRRSSRAVNAEIDAMFMTCLKETQSSEWHSGYYTFLFLGPLPHLLVCLERGIALTRAAKAKTKGLLNKESHEKLEELGKQRSELAALLRKGLKLRKQLEPSSPAHRDRGIDALKSGVLEVDEFMQGVPGNMKDMQSDFQMAYKGIVAKRVPPGKEKERPALNVEDMNEC
ncbi:uncharacterized protein HD556DRAFT_1287696 [Suillus plorans]|uniref:UvrD-like helicase ATP-binding domain-containing protein n=1 Tax=Suillus plorans TaxID=116603 RepID=A0A9P7J262_9AGAM|nr:uncharacterized protein HD556DRAFT_1287696 [Suillus plorans]KAG1799293.1 hypothetical protein HD556DRAFT_1287696 [Suillus plorans]